MPAPVNRDHAGNLLPEYYSRPGQLRQEYGVDAVLALANADAEYLLQTRPPVPQQVFPPKFGYRREALTVYDVLATDRWAPVRRSWTSGASSLGNPRVDEIQFGHGGEQRNSLTGLNYTA